jgi:CubicO group peptidase (beta-lactamase class C family)
VGIQATHVLFGYDGSRIRNVAYEQLHSGINVMNNNRIKDGSRWCFLYALALITIASSEFILRGDEQIHQAQFGKRSVVQAVAEEQIEKQSLVGLALGVIEDRQIAYTAAFGWEDRENKIPATTAKTLYRWASISKTVTAISALQLAEQGKLDLDLDVRSYVPEFPDRGHVITSRQLLSHQSGIVHYQNGPVIRTSRTYDRAHPFEDVVLALDTFKESPLLHAPGKKYSYSTHGYILLSAVVERAGGAPFWNQVQSRIATPLQLRTFQPDYAWVDIPNRAVGYARHGDSIQISTDTDVSWKLGGGGFLSNIDDLARMARAYICRELVTEQTEALMWTPQSTSTGDATTYGLGFQISDSREGPLVVSHSGSQEKARTYMLLYPTEGRGVVVMTNCEWGNPTQVSKALASRLWPDLARRSLTPAR